MYVCVCVYHVCAWCPRKSEKDIRSPEIGVTGVCEMPCGWVLGIEPWSSLRAVVLFLPLQKGHNENPCPRPTGKTQSRESQAPRPLLERVPFPSSPLNSQFIRCASPSTSYGKDQMLPGCSPPPPQTHLPKIQAGCLDRLLISIWPTGLGITPQ